MKIRQGFVSNSSSSSFIIIENCDIDQLECNSPILYIDNNFGNTEFGWEFEKYNDIESKIIFCYLQTQEFKEGKWFRNFEDNKWKKLIEDNKWLEMLETVIKEHSNGTIETIEWDVDGYIDHQSSSIEGQCIEMFENENTLTNFIFCNDSYIKTGNDNEEDYYED